MFITFRSILWRKFIDFVICGQSIPNQQYSNQKYRSQITGLEWLKAQNFRFGKRAAISNVAHIKPKFATARKRHRNKEIKYHSKPSCEEKWCFGVNTSLVEQVSQWRWPIFKPIAALNDRYWFPLEDLSLSVATDRVSQCSDWLAEGEYWTQRHKWEGCEDLIGEWGRERVVATWESVVTRALRTCWGNFEKQQSAVGLNGLQTHEKASYRQQH